MPQHLSTEAATRGRRATFKPRRHTLLALCGLGLLGLLRLGARRAPRLALRAARAARDLQRGASEVGVGLRGEERGELGVARVGSCGGSGAAAP